MTHGLKSLILGALTRGEQYGLEIVSSVRSMDARRTVSLGALYTTLHRLEHKGLVESRWGDDAPGDERRGPGDGITG
jgi:DNA-binding PadR family transcriptional regulator